MPAVEPINLRVTASAAGLKSELGNAQAYVRTFAQQIEGQNRQVAAAVAKIGGALRGLTTLPALVAGGSVGFAFKLAADAEQAQVAFEVLTGSAEKAKSVIAELTDFAAKTPFQLPEIRDAGRLLLAFGFSAEELGQQLTVMGNLAAGTNQPIGELAELIGKARVQNTIFSEDINQLTGRGINVLDGLSKQFGVTTSEVKKLASQGKIGFEDLNAVLQKLAGEGGQFGGLMEKQSRTAAGAFSTLIDNVKGLATDMTKVFQPALKSSLASLTSTVESLRGMKVEVVESRAKLAALVGGFVASLVIIPRVIAAINGIIIAVRSFTTASIIAQAVSGPKGWLTLAASVSVALFAVNQLDQAFGNYRNQVFKVAGAHKEVEVRVAATTRATRDFIATLNGGKDTDLATQSLEKLNTQLSESKTRLDAATSAAAAMYLELARNGAGGLVDGEIEQTKQGIEELEAQVSALNNVISDLQGPGKLYEGFGTLTGSIFYGENFKKRLETFRAEQAEFQSILKEQQDKLKSLYDKQSEPITQETLKGFKSATADAKALSEQIQKLSEAVEENKRKFEEQAEAIRKAGNSAAPAQLRNTNQVSRRDSTNADRALERASREQVALSQDQVRLLREIKSELRISNNAPPINIV